MRLIFIFAFAVAVFALTDAHAETSGGSDPAQLLAKARRARDEGREAQAAQLAAKAAKHLEGRELGYARLLEGMALFASGNYSGSEKALSQAAPLLPNLADRVALSRANALYKAEQYEDARDQYIKARSAAAVEMVAMYADLGRVKAMLNAGDSRAIQRASQLLIRYPSLPERQEIEYEIAYAIEKQGRKAAAYVRYRKLWLKNPQGRAGQLSGERLQVLANEGVRVAPVKHTEHLERVRELIRDREFDSAEQEIIAALRTAKGSLQLHLQRELAVVAYRRNEIERARALLMEVQDRRGPVGPWPERVDVASGITASAIRRILKGRAATRGTPPGKLVRVAEIHIEAGEYAKARRALGSVKMARAPGFLAKWLPWISFKTGDYDKALPGFKHLHQERWSQGRRRYWVGRAQQKAGRPCEARAAFEDAIRAAPHGYYGLWARQRLAQLRDSVAADRAKQGAKAPPLRCPAPTEEDPEATAAWTDPDPLMLWKMEPRQRTQPTLEEGLDAFEQLIKAHGDALPWLERARDLWLAGDVVGSGEELHQTLWASRGFLAPKAGLPRLWGGQPRIKRPGKRRPARFTSSQMELYVRAAEAVGETGLAIRANRPDWSDHEGWHPLAFEPMLRNAAKRHGIQPQLMWSIMRIESYFNRHAISHANALGLMQILPRTGRRVARRMKAQDFQVADLLTPRRGLDFSAWYLKALSDRFHGQYPLMIAAYNGGPHNVAYWILRRSDTEEPLHMDEFCEEIPFSESYRYVRRVTSSLAVYHALAGLPPPELPLLVNRDVKQGVNF